MTMSTVIETFEAGHAPPWAKSCKNPFIKHDWDWIPLCWEPDVAFDAMFVFNQRCTECKLVCIRMIAENGRRKSYYNESTRPPDYKYEEDDEPTTAQYAHWFIEVAEERQQRRQRRRNTRQTRAQRPKKAVAA